jgi:Xaa-Pro aminopeptidase
MVGMEDSDPLVILRKNIKKQSLDGYVQPVHDEYMSEYPPACNRRVEWLSGFSGSAGTVVVLAEKAALFVDGRYTLQAANEVNEGIYEQHNSGTLTPEAWIARETPAGSVIGYDPKVYTQSIIKRMQKALDAKDITLKPTANLVDAIWEDRPAVPASHLFIHELEYSGEESMVKRQRIAEQLKTLGADVAVLTAPDAVCWLLNIRGRDVENTPLALVTAIIDSQAGVHLFVSPSRCDGAMVAHLGSSVELCDPAILEHRLALLGKSGKRVLCDPTTVPVWFMQVLSKMGAKIIEGQDPCLLPKATKNAVELEGICSAHIRDGIAVTKLLCWLDSEIYVREVSELDVSDKLLLFRATHPLFLEPSFNTIVGSGPHGAIVHYRATQESNRILKKGELLLLDSGGQYSDGTTDITRTVAIGEPTREHRDRFTRVLKGHIALATALFPIGTTGSQLDVLARQFLWQVGLDYDHGTGHGVGCFLGVHEGPQRISKRGGDAPLQAGMIISNEPGYYKTGAYGIRIENLVAVTRQSHGQGGKDWLGFETVTCAPLDIKLVDAALLTATEKDWLNAYNAWVLSSLSDGLTGHERQWLMARCAPLG